jgi:hypothetical protein
MRDWIKSMSGSDRIMAAIIGGFFVVAASIISVIITQHNVAANVRSPDGTVIAHPTNAGSATLPPSPASSGASRPAASSDPAANVIFSGPVEFDGNNCIDFDASPPTSDDNCTVSLDTAPPAILAGSPNYVAAWPNTSMPTLVACREWVETHPLGSVPVQVGAQICIRSVGLRTIFLKVTGLDVEAGTINASVIVWSS